MPALRLLGWVHSVKTVVVKIGGSTLGSGDTALPDLVALQREGRAIVVVHGGGRVISEWLERCNVATRFERGLRVTDSATLDVVVAVLCGLVNTQLVAAIGALGGRAVGLCGADGRLIEARVKDPALGYTGEVVRVNTGPIESLLREGYMPVIAPLGVDRDGPAGQLLNINADTAAGEIASALGAEGLLLLTDVAGVMDGVGRPIPRLSAAEASALIAQGVIMGGMIPKVEACLCALSTVAVAHIVDGRLPCALRAALDEGGAGTTICEHREK